MGRCITFDGHTADALCARSIDSRVQNGAGNALDAALATESPRALALLPARNRDRVLLVSMARRSAQIQAMSQASPIRYQAGGFLGLSDEPVYESEKLRPKRWWRMLWE